MKNKIKSVVLMIIIMVLNSCEENIYTPVDNGDLRYEWTIDTLKNPSGADVAPWGMWGNNPQDVWIVGFNTFGQGEIFHYKSINWERVTPNLSFRYEVLAVFGFAENDVYVVGSKIIIDSALHSESLILHYDGNNWMQELINEKVSGLKYLYGRNANDIWACGYDGALFHKTGGMWIKASFDQRKYLGLLSEQPDLGPIYVAPSGNVYLMNEYYNYKLYGDTAMFYFSKYSNHIWETLDSCRLVNIDGIPVGYKFGNRAMWGVSESEIYSVGYAAYQFNGNEWKGLGGSGEIIRDIKGTLSNKIYEVGDHGYIAYYDRISWKGIGDYQKFLVNFYSIMPFEDEIFIGANDLRNGYVLHRRLVK